MIRDRDAKDGTAFDAVLASGGIEVKPSAPQRPEVNAHAERFVPTTRSAVTDQMLILGERHVRHLMTVWERHYNTGRPHMALNGRAPADEPNVIRFPARSVQRREHLGGLLNEYEQAA